jgi:hypothetical protein
MTERSDDQDYAIELTPLAVEMLGAVNDRRAIGLTSLPPSHPSKVRR